MLDIFQVTPSVRSFSLFLLLSKDNIRSDKIVQMEFPTGSWSPICVTYSHTNTFVQVMLSSQSNVLCFNSTVMKNFSFHDQDEHDLSYNWTATDIFLYPAWYWAATNIFTCIYPAWQYRHIATWSLSPPRLNHHHN